MLVAPDNGPVTEQLRQAQFKRAMKLADPAGLAGYHGLIINVGVADKYVFVKLHNFQEKDILCYSHVSVGIPVNRFLRNVFLRNDLLVIAEQPQLFIAYFNIRPGEVVDSNLILFYRGLFCFVHSYAIEINLLS